MKLLKVFFLLLVFTHLGFSQKKELDQRLVGRWLNLFVKDLNGEIIKNKFHGKNYIDTYLKNGEYLIDPNYLRDDLKRNGIKGSLDYSLIPSFKWKT
jgi:hypothetical protein